MDREIADAGAPESGSAAATPVAVEPRQADALVTEATASLRAVEGFQPDPVNAARTTRRGCLVALAIAFTVMLVTFTAIYFIGYRDRGLLSAPAEPHEKAVPAPRR